MSGISDQEPLKMIIIGGPGTGKSTSIKAVTKVLNDNNTNFVLQLGTTGTASFCNIRSHGSFSLGVSVNCTFVPLQVLALLKIPQRLQPYKIIIIDEISIMGLKILSYIDKRLRQDFGKMDIPFGGYAIIFVGDFQQLPSICDTCLCGNDGSSATLIYYSISNVVIIHEIHHHAGE